MLTIKQIAVRTGSRRATVAVYLKRSNIKPTRRETEPPFRNLYGIRAVAKIEDVLARRHKRV